MNILRASSENEMILLFLQAEQQSERFSDQLTEVMQELGLEPELILSADLHNETENKARKRLLGAYRGYGEEREMFENFPQVTQWQLCSFERPDLENIRYIHYCYWEDLSGGTCSPLDAAQMIRKDVRIYDISNEGFLRTADYLQKGGTFPKMIFLTPDWEHFVIVEGHLRMTAYALVPQFFHGVEAIVGKCSAEALAKWM